MDAIKATNINDDIDEIVKARRFIESRGLCVMDLRLSPTPIDPTAIDDELPSKPDYLATPAKFVVGPSGEPIGYLPMRIVWVIAVGMTLFGIGIANRL